jgi:Holliday junction resolvase RusA-like endonuclease
MSRIDIDILGDPQPQPRPRAYVGRHGSARVYNPSTADAWRDTVAMAVASRRPRNFVRFAGPVRVAAIFRLPRPARHYGASGRLLSREIACCRKPDLDNLIKAVLDALNDCGVWGDDAQVSSLSCVKRYVARDEQPGVLLTIEGDAHVSE